MLQFPQTQFANILIFTPPAMTTEPYLRHPSLIVVEILGNLAFLYICPVQLFVWRLCQCPSCQSILEDGFNSCPEKSNLQTIRKLRFPNCILFMKCGPRLPILMFTSLVQQWIHYPKYRKLSIFFEDSKFNALMSPSPWLNLIYSVLELFIWSPICFTDVSTQDEQLGLF